MLNRLLTIFFAAVLVIIFGYLVAGLASLPLYYERTTTQTVATAILSSRELISNHFIATEAAERGLTLEQYALYRNFFNASVALIPAFIAVFIIWRARRQWFAWFSACITVFLGSYALSEQTLVARLISLEVYGAGAILWFLVLLFFFLFPNGQAVPRRAGWIVLALVIYHFFIQVGTVLAYWAPEFLARTNLPNWGQSLAQMPVYVNFFIILVCQIYRYRRVSTLVERQQTKWFLLGFGVIVACIPIALYSGGRGGFLDDASTLALYTPLPLAIAFAALRYRLWDIDIIIRRTLQYSLLSGLLGLTYFGLITVLQSIFRAISNQQSEISIVLSTLAIAALFFPLRNRVQEFIDKRFYRKKYDAQKVIADFAATCRDETDLDKLVLRLEEVIDETLQPEKVSVWIKDSNARTQGREDAKS